MKQLTAAVLALLATATLGGAALAQQQAPSAAAQAAIAKLAFLDGVWIGPATMTSPDGKKSSFTQMERIGPMNRGEIRVMEGKARDAEGGAQFNAFTVFSAAADGGVTMRSYTTGGSVGERQIELKPDGFVWGAPAGAPRPRYIITIKDGVWHETGVVTVEGRTLTFFEMTLKRVAGSDWPAANPAFSTKD